MNRLANVKKAVRPALKGRMMLSGPAGSGKTRSALMIAEALAEGGRVLVIDTEKESALTYADDFTFEHLAWDEPFDPRDLTGAVREAGRMFDVVIVDSLTHFWRATGGTLDIANGKFTGWKEARPAQEDLVRAVLEADAHMLVCVRSKMKHEQVVENGRHVVKKLGVGPIQDDDLEYEVNVSLSIDMGHTISVVKSRTTALPVGRDFNPGHATDLAELYRDWLKGGEPPAGRDVINSLVERMNQLAPTARAAVKQEFVATLGRPDHLTEAKLPDAEALVARYENTGAAGSDAASARGDHGAAPVAVGPDGGSPQESSPSDTAEPSGPAAPTDAVRTVAQLAQRAQLAFTAVAEAAPKGKKTAWLDRMRHAAVSAATGGEHTSMKNLDAAGLADVWALLGDIIDGHLTFTFDMDDDKGVTFVDGDGASHTVLWAELEQAVG